MNGNEPATKQDLADLKKEFHTDMGQLRTDMDQLRSEMNHSYRDVVERLDDIGTKMLTAFYNVAETHGKRLSDLDSSDAALRSRLSTVEKRIMEIEKRLNFPPAA
jgi:tetrahydromethanopterin S-methyltransferase subunit G